MINISCLLSTVLKVVDIFAADVTWQNNYPVSTIRGLLFRFFPAQCQVCSIPRPRSIMIILTKTCYCYFENKKTTGQYSLKWMWEHWHIILFWSLHVSFIIVFGSHLIVPHFHHLFCDPPQSYTLLVTYKTRTHFPWT